MTFSKNLAMFIRGKNPGHEVWKLDFVLGAQATKDSVNCVFGIVSVKNWRLLRGAVSWEEADFLTQCASRIPVEMRLRAAEKVA